MRDRYFEQKLVKSAVRSISYSSSVDSDGRWFSPGLSVPEAVEYPLKNKNPIAFSEKGDKLPDRSSMLKKERK